MLLKKLGTTSAMIATLALSLTVSAPVASPASAAPVVSSTIALPAGSYPASVAFSTAGIGVAKAYVANANDTMSVIFLDGDRDPITFSLPADTGATSVAVIGYDVYVANYRAGTVSVIDGGTDSYWRSIALPAGSSPLSVAFSPGGIAYVANGSGDTVSVLGPVSVISTIQLPEGSNPASSAFSPDGSKAYVANNGSSTVSVIITFPSEITSAPRKLRAGTTTTRSVALRWRTPASLNGGIITDYLIQYRQAGTSRWLTFPHATSTARKRTVTGLTAGTRYRFKVAAKTAVGTSRYSRAVYKTTLAR